MRSAPAPARAAAGAAIGVGTVLVSAALAGAVGRETAFTVLLVLALSVTGLGLGALSALAAFVAGAIALVALTVTDPAGMALGYSDVVRIGAFLLGSPVIVYLVHRGEVDRRAAADALTVSRAAHAQSAVEQERLEASRRETALALVRAERERARLEEVAEAVPEPLVVYDDRGVGTYGNRAALRLLGRSFVERSLEEWERSVEPRDEHGAALRREEWPQVVAQRQSVRRRLLLRLPMSGRDVLVDVEGTPIPGGGAVLLLRDVGKEEDQRRRLSRFASFVAHELRNPLAVAKARIELARRDPALPERAGMHATRALESVDAAIGILERLELYSRADAGRIEAVNQEFDLGPALGEAVERVRARGSERAVMVRVPPKVRVVGDRQLSVQAITNLLTNADRYSTPAEPIDVEVEAGEQVTLRVRDAGPGIADDVAPLLFRDPVAAGRGLGLGLYLVNASMEAMGGSVTLEQQRPLAVLALRWPAAT